MTKREILEAAEKGEGPLGRSLDDEPVFLLVARDRYAAHAVRNWAGVLSLYHGSASARKTTAALKVAEAMDEWRERNGGGKVPD